MDKLTRQSADALAKTMRSMREKILERLDDFEQADLTYEAQMGDGRYIIRANPFVQEFRALVKDYCSVVKAYAEITGKQSEEEAKSLDTLRERFRVIK